MAYKEVTHHPHEKSAKGFPRHYTIKGDGSEIGIAIKLGKGALKFYPLESSGLLMIDVESSTDAETMKDLKNTIKKCFL